MTDVSVLVRRARDGDLAAFEERAHEPEIAFELVLKKLKKDGKI